AEAVDGVDSSFGTCSVIMKGSDTLNGYSFHFLRTYKTFQGLSLFCQDGFYVVVVLVAVGAQHDVSLCFGLWNANSFEGINNDCDAFSLQFETRMTMPYNLNQTELISFPRVLRQRCSY